MADEKGFHGGTVGDPLAARSGKGSDCSFRIHDLNAVEDQSASKSGLCSRLAVHCEYADTAPILGKYQVRHKLSQTSYGFA